MNILGVLDLVKIVSIIEIIDVLSFVVGNKTIGFSCAFGISLKNEQFGYKFLYK